MKPKKAIFKEIAGLLEDNNTSNDLKANKARKLVERALKLKLAVDRSETVKLSTLFNIYFHQKQAHDFRSIGKKLINQLNKYSHDTADNLKDNEIKELILDTNKLLELVLETKNIHIERIPQIAAEPEADYGLNTGQVNAVKSAARITNVIAGPGTGKTHLIIERIVNQIKSGQEKHIAAISFTNQAASNIRERLMQRLFDESLLDRRQQVFTGTIHSYAFNSIKQYHEEVLGKQFNFSIIDSEEEKEIREEFGGHQGRIQEFLTDNNLLTFDDILDNFNEYLSSNHRFRDHVSSTLAELLIDEAQDLSKTQYEIFKKLYDLDHSISLFLVGDPRQNIFTFLNGSFDHFHSVFGEEVVHTINLTQSYRCPNGVLNLINSFKFGKIENIPLVNRNNGIPERKPVYHTFLNKTQEASYIADLIKTSERELNDIAILYRDSFYFTEIGKALNEAAIPFKLYGGQTYLIGEIRFLKNLLHATLNQNTFALSKITAYWEVSKEFREKDFQKRFQSIREFLESDTTDGQKSKKAIKYTDQLNASMTFIAQHLGIGEDGLISLLESFISFSKKTPAFLNHLSALAQSLLEVVVSRGIETYNDLIPAFSPNDEDFSQFYRKTSDIRFDGDLGDQFVTLSTIHSAKGREWDIVIIPGMTNDLFPRYNKKIEDLPEFEDKDREAKDKERIRHLNNEKKSLYVACSRAVERLYLFRPASYSVPKKFGNGFYFFEKDISAFLEEPLAQGLLEPLAVSGSLA